MKLLLFTLGVILINTSAFCQEKKQQSTETTIISSVPVQISDLEFNGINTSQISITLNHNDLEKLRYFDFSPYRLYNSSQKIQILDGPIIEIYSVEKMISKGMVYDENYIHSKMDVDNSTVSHATMPLVNIGYGKYTSEEKY